MDFKIILLSLFTMTFTACATRANYEQKVSSWEGKHVDVLVAQWGVPDGNFTRSDGTQLLVYKKSYSHVYQYHNTQAMTPETMYGEPVIYKSSCETTFTVQPNKLISAVSFKGNACRSR